MTHRGSSAGSVGIALVVLVTLACMTPRPVIRDRLGRDAPGVMQRLIVLPFQLEAAEIDDLAATELLERFVAEELSRVGYDVIPSQDFRVADEQAEQRPADQRERLRLADQEFGASGALSGRVLRYRQRKGQQYGALRPASVAFELKLHDVSSARLVWSGSFDETQQALTLSPARARGYPGGGTRWLTAAELTQWGAQAAVARLKQHFP